MSAALERPLTPRQARFVAEYLIDLNATQAAIRAGYSAKTAEQQGPRLLGYAQVAAAIQKAQAKRAEQTEITAEEVLRQWWAIATADPNELIDVRRVCCRYCYGEDHRYQFTARELEEARASWEARPLREGEAAKPFDPQGGDGFDGRRPPHPECPECFGDGIHQVFPKDTRDLSPAARLLYAGVKQTKEGIEIKLRDQDAALVNVAKHLGMFIERTDLTTGGKPLPPTNITVALVRPAPERIPEIREAEYRILPTTTTSTEDEP
jgi:hypothetical protein